MGEVEEFVRQTVVERSASVLVTGPRGAGDRFLRGLIEALGDQPVHVVVIVGNTRDWLREASGRSVLHLVGFDAEVTPGQALRSALRQDPDVIVCDHHAGGDLEMLIKTAMTGHQVLAYLPGDFAAAEAAAPVALGTAFDLGVEFDEAGLVRLCRFAGFEESGEVLYDRAQPDPLPRALPERTAATPSPQVAPDPLALDVIEAARVAQAGLLRRSWRPVLEAPSGDPVCSKLGGAPMLGHDEAWPTCPSCARALPLVLQLRCAQLPAEAPVAAPPGAGWLQLFYCDSPRCDCSDPAAPGAANRVLRWLPADGVQPAAATPDPMGDVESRTWGPADVTGWREIQEVPDPEDWNLDAAAEDACDVVREQVLARDMARREGAELPAEHIEDEALRTLAGARDGDKLLGWPAWEQGADWTTCPKCGERRALLFQLDARQGHLRALFAADGKGRVTVCPSHPEELAFGWACG